MMTFKTKLTAIALTIVVALFSAGFTDCGGGGSGGKNAGNKAAEKEKTPEEIATERVNGAVDGMSIAAVGINEGIDFVRMFREAGKIEPETSLVLATVTRDGNTIMREAVLFLNGGAIDEAGRIRLKEFLSSILNTVERLNNEGVLRIKNPEAQFRFNFSVLAIRAGLNIISNRLDVTIPANFSIPITPELRAKLNALLEKIDQNGKRLNEAIERLSKIQP
jgi:hypothetical protein